MKTEKIQQALSSFAKRHSVDTVQASIYENGKTYFVSNKPDIEPLIYEFASITKLVTAFAIMMACEDEKLSLSATLSTIFKKRLSIDSSMADIKIIEVLKHSSGFPNLPKEFLDIMKDHPDNPYSVLDKQMVFDYLTFGSDIGVKKYVYSNFGYGLLGLIIEEIYNCSLEEFFNDRIFIPLDMINSSLNKPSLINQHKLIQGYDCKGGPTHIWEDHCLEGAGALLSTTEDFMKLLQSHFADNRFSSTLNNMLVLQNNKMAIGWHRKGWGARVLGFGSWLWHNGAVGGCCSYTAINKKKNAAFVIVANKGYPIDELGIEITSHFVA